MIVSWKMERREYGRQQKSMNSIPIDIAPLLRQYLRLSLNGAIKMKIPPSFLIASWRQ
jgi:hypothetical protein